MMDCRFQAVDAKKVALQNFLAPTNKKVTLTNASNNDDDRIQKIIQIHKYQISRSTDKADFTQQNFKS